jgi:leucine dehydrogenase
MKVYDTIHEIAERSQHSLTPTYRVADLLVEEKLAAVVPPPTGSRAG